MPSELYYIHAAKNMITKTTPAEKPNENGDFNR